MKQDYEAKLKINNKRILHENLEKGFLASYSLDNDNCTHIHELPCFLL